MARPAYIAFAGENGYKKTTIRSVEQAVGTFRCTKPMESPSVAVSERVVNIDKVLLIDLIALSLPLNLLKACAWPWRTAVVDSMEWQLWSCMASGCSAKVMPVFFSYSFKANSKRELKRVDPEWPALSRVGKKYEC